MPKPLVAKSCVSEFDLFVFIMCLHDTLVGQERLKKKGKKKVKAAAAGETFKQTLFAP